MADMDNDELFDAPKVSECLEFGGTLDKPRTRDRFWYRAMLSDSDPRKGEGLIIKVGKRPHTRRNDDEPHPTLRLMRENPAGMLFAKIRSGDLRVENYYDFHNRLALMRMDEEEKDKAKEAKKKEKEKQKK